MQELNQNYLSEHHPHFGVAYFVAYQDVNPGDVITFQYKGKMRWVFVLDPHWEKKCHGLTLELVPRKILEDEVIGAMFETDKPENLYETAIWRIAKDYDSYRTYFVSDIKMIRRIPYFLKEKPVIRKQ